jgi:hypothetical protein
LLFYSRRSVTPVNEEGVVPSLEPGDALVVTQDQVPAWFRARGLRRVASGGGVTLWTFPRERSIMR